MRCFKVNEKVFVGGICRVGSYLRCHHQFFAKLFFNFKNKLLHLHIFFTLSLFSIFLRTYDFSWAPTTTLETAHSLHELTTYLKFDLNWNILSRKQRHSTLFMFILDSLLMHTRPNSHTNQWTWHTRPNSHTNQWIWHISPNSHTNQWNCLVLIPFLCILDQIHVISHNHQSY